MTDPEDIARACGEYLEAVVEGLGDRRSKTRVRFALMNMAGFAFTRGHEQGQKDLLDRFIPVRFEGDAIGFAELDQETGQALLKQWTCTEE